jgi:antitoxin (DNA-binding transcriptional repressor) of toxin-antitoxin stability system
VKTIEIEAAPRLDSLLAQVKLGQEILLTERATPIAKIVPAGQMNLEIKGARGGIWENSPGFWMSPDFDDPLEEFRQYME